MMRPVTEKICETLGCSQPAHQQRPIAPGTNLWLCAKCWEKMKQEDDERYFEHHPREVNRDRRTD